MCKKYYIYIISIYIYIYPLLMHWSYLSYGMGYWLKDLICIVGTIASSRKLRGGKSKTILEKQKLRLNSPAVLPSVTSKI